MAGRLRSHKLIVFVIIIVKIDLSSGTGRRRRFQPPCSPPTSWTYPWGSSPRPRPHLPGRGPSLASSRPRPLLGVFPDEAEGRRSGTGEARRLWCRSGACPIGSPIPARRCAPSGRTKREGGVPFRLLWQPIAPGSALARGRGDLGGDVRPCHFLRPSSRPHAKPESREPEAPSAGVLLQPFPASSRPLPLLGVFPDEAEGRRSGTGEARRLWCRSGACPIGSPIPARRCAPSGRTKREGGVPFRLLWQPIAPGSALARGRGDL